MDNRNTGSDTKQYLTPAQRDAEDARIRALFARYAGMNKNEGNPAKNPDDYGPRGPRGPAPTSPPTMTAQNSLGIDGPKPQPQITVAPPLRYLEM